MVTLSNSGFLQWTCFVGYVSLAVSWMWSSWYYLHTLIKTFSFSSLYTTTTQTQTFRDNSVSAFGDCRPPPSSAQNQRKWVYLGYGNGKCLKKRKKNIFSDREPVVSTYQLTTEYNIATALYKTINITFSISTQTSVELYFIQKLI